jgi:predicted hotdog family 3-hydroxylacyl-ACP dehydratase
MEGFKPGGSKAFFRLLATSIAVYVHLVGHRNGKSGGSGWRKYKLSTRIFASTQPMTKMTKILRFMRRRILVLSL